MLDALKSEISDLLHLSRDALHVHLGLAVMLLAMILFRKSPASVVPWLCVLALELVNELLDVHWYRGGLQFSPAGALKDIVNTMLWPTIILLLARYAWPLRRRLQSGSRRDLSS